VKYEAESKPFNSIKTKEYRMTKNYYPNSDGTKAQGISTGKQSVPERKVACLIGIEDFSISQMIQILCNYYFC